MRTEDIRSARMRLLKNMLPLPSTTLLVSPRTEGLDLIGLEKPEDEVLEEPEQHLSMHERQRASRHGGGEKPLQEAEAALSGTA